MKRDLLQKLLDAGQTKATLVLATDLSDGAQTLIDLSTGGPSAVPDQIRSAARAASLADRSGTVELDDGRRIFLNVYNPPLRMIVVGAVHITQALAPIASLTGYDVTVVDPRSAFATPERLPGMTLSHAWPDEAMVALKPDRRTAVITLTHDPKLDDPALQAGLRSDCFYIGALGSRKTHAARLERLRLAGFGEEATGRIHGPIGLAIGARSPAEIAIAIMAQVTERLRADRDRQTPVATADGHRAA